MQKQWPAAVLLLTLTLASCEAPRATVPVRAVQTTDEIRDDAVNLDAGDVRLDLADPVIETKLFCWASFIPAPKMVIAENMALKTSSCGER